MKRLIIAIGGYGTGKTSFSRWYAKQNDGLYIDFDVVRRFRCGGFADFCRRLSSIIKGSQKQLFVMDNYGDYLTDPHFNCLRKRLGDVEVQVCFCFAAPHIVHQRQLRKAHMLRPHSVGEIIVNTFCYYFFVAATDGPLFMDTTSGFHFVSQSLWPQRWLELKFLAELDGRKHERYYQDIELPSGVTVRGTSKTGQTWERLSALVDFAGRDVLDVGSNHGFISFKVEESGARGVTGVEINRNAIEVAREVAWLRQSEVCFHQGDIATFNPHATYDIALVLNALHHTGDVRATLETVFGLVGLAVFETPVEHESLITEYAARSGFILAERANSHREGREIVIYAKAEGMVREVPAAYRYDYKKELRVWRLWRVVAKILRLRVAFPLLLLIKVRRCYIRQTAKLRRRYIRRPTKYIEIKD